LCEGVVSENSAELSGCSMIVAQEPEKDPQPDGVNHGPSLLGRPSAPRVTARLNFRILRGAGFTLELSDGD
jgi:hypothetical protein